jgi:lysophospholipid acyltransferase (LPLAT)-like uncharacterized protein
MVPYPFAQGLFLYGPPIWVSREADMASIEATRLEVEAVLNRLTAEAEEAVIDGKTRERGGKGKR